MLNRQKGSATMIAIVTMMFLAILAGAASTLVNNDLRFSKTNNDVIEAQFAAEAGAKRAITMFYQTAQVWTWLDADNTPKWQSLGTDANKKYHVKTTLNNVQIVPTSPAGSGLYTITSTGSVNGTIRTVSVPITVTAAAAANSVMSKYSVYSNGNLDIYGGSTPAPYLNLDIGTNGSYVKINSGSNFLLGKLYTSHAISSDSWYPNGPKDAKGNPTWYVQQTAAQVGALNATIPTVPTMPANASSNTALPSNVSYGCYNTTYSLPNDYYYYNGSYQLNNTILTAASGKTVTLYINGDLYLTGTSSIIGDNVVIYTKGNVKLDSTSSIKVSNASKTSSLKIYAQGTVYLTVNAEIDGDNVLIESNSSSDSAFKMDNYTSINKNSTTAVTQIYSNGSVYLTGNPVTIGGKAGMVVTNSYVKLDNSVQAANTIFIANDVSNQSSYITGTVNIAGIFVNGSLKIDGSPSVNKNSQKDAILQTLGSALQNVTGGSPGSGSGSPTISIGIWNKL